MKASSLALLSTVLLTTGLAPLARAQLPAGAQVIHGDVSITQSGSAMTISQTSRNAIVNWQSFNLGADATLRLQQNGANAAMLARVTGNDPSQLLGTLKADGKLFLINPRGIVVGQGAVIDTAAFVASTLNVSDSDFLGGGPLTFKGDSNAGIVNLGQINAREGNVLLFAHTVKNAGTISAANGTAGLGAGTEVYLASPDAPDFVIKTNLPASTEKTGVDNTGVITAARAQLEAAGGSIYELAINQGGVVRATGSATVNGRVLLTAAGGTVGVSGEVSARNADGSGGEILVGGDYQGANGTIANAARTVVTSTGKLDASATKGTGAAGRVIVWANDATHFLGSLNAAGQGGGFAEVSGRHFLDFNPASVAQLGAGGTLLLDPDALVISTDPTSGTGTSGTDPFHFNITSEPATLNVTTLQNQLAASNVILDTSTSAGDITFNSAVTWATNNTLTARAGGSININADITGGAASGLALYAGRYTTSTLPGELGGVDLRPSAILNTSAAITVGTLTYGANAASNVADQTVNSPAQTGLAFFEGNLHVGTLAVDLSGGAAGVVTDGTDNTIGAFRTTGTGSLSTAYVVNHHGALDLTLNSASAEGPYLQFITPGNLTLKSGSNLNFTDPGTVLLASTSGAVVNEAGAGVFGANTRFLIYSSTTSATNKGGLTGTDVFNHPYDINDYFDDTTSRFFFTALSGSPILTYTANSLARTYGAANAALTYTTTGWVDGVTNDVTGAPSLSTTATQSSGVGAYAIAITSGTLASSNYDFSFIPGTLTIERAPLTITANDKTRRVNLANPDFDATFSGFVLGENTSALGGTLGFSTPAMSNSSAGIYAITPSGLTSSNYAISFVPGTLTLTENAALLISADSFTRTYGASNPTFTASYNGFVGGDTASVVSGLQFSTAATQSSAIGQYTITPFGASATGYAISYASGSLTIERAPLAISVPNQSRYYGDANNLFANFNGLVNGETSSVVSGLSLTTAATQASNVGNYAITAAGASAANYSITYAQGLLSILPASLTVSIANATRLYGDADPAFIYGVSGLKNDDTAASSVSVTGLSSLASANAGIGAYGIIGFSSVISPNYSVTTQPGTLTITPRPVTITADNKTRVYGDANPAFTVTYTGLASFDTSSAFGALNFSTQATTTSGVGNWGITFSTVANPNYIVTPVFGTLTINPAPLTLGYLLDASRLYGRTDPALTLPTVDGLKNSDTIAGLGLSFTGVPTATADVGAYTYSVASTNPNYTFTAPTATFRIAPAPLTVAIGSGGRIYGDENPASYDLNVSGLAFNDTATSVVAVSNPTEARTDIGTYALSPLLLNHNYIISSLTGGSFVISPRVLTLTAADRTKVYGDVNPFFYGDITGFAPGDSALAIITNYGFVTTADTTSGVGTYTIRPTAQTTTTNYVTTSVEGTLSVTRAPLSVTIADASRTYGQANPAFSAASAQGLKNQDTLASLNLALSTVATTTSDAGVYPITGASTSPNYAVTFNRGALTINRASALISVNDASRLFGDIFTTNPFSLTFTGFLTADEAIARSNWQLVFTDDATLAPDRYPVGFTAANVLTTAALGKNYAITLKAGTLDVTPRPLTIAVPDVKLPFGTTLPASFAVATPDVPAGSPAFTVVGHTVTTDGKVAIVPETVPGAGVTQAELDRYFTFDFKPGALTFTLSTTNVDLNHQLDPTINTPKTTINKDVPTPDKTIDVDTDKPLTLTKPTDVAYDNPPLTKADFAGYFTSFASQTDAIKAALAGSYSDFLKGQGKSGSAYETMTAGARTLLAQWVSGTLSTADLSALIAAGNADASAAFAFIMPTLIDMTRAKNIADMTAMDREILGRLADLTEQRKDDTIKIAQQKYQQMLADNALKAQMNGLANIFVGPGDFQAIVADASNEAITKYIAATVGVGVGTSAGYAALASIPAVVTAIFPSSGLTVMLGASAGPGIAVTMAVTLAVRAVQISESIKNEQDFNNLMNSWKLDQQITSIAQLKSAAMSQDIKLSTIMLSAELLKAGP